jgi:hypothetical protein
MLRIPVVALMVLPLAAARLAAQGSSGSEPAVHWMPAPALFPRGAQTAVLSGDPFKPVVFLTYVHPSDEPWGVFPYGY